MSDAVLSSRAPTAPKATTEAARPARGRPRDPELDDEILAAAAAIVSESGMEALTMDAVARRAGVAKATIYRRFPGKVDLIVATCNSVAPALPPTPDTGSVRGDLLVLLDHVLESVQGDDRGSMMPSVIATAACNPEVREALHRFSANRRSRLTKVLKRAIERGELYEGIDAELVGDQLVGALTYRSLVAGRPLNRAVLERLVDQTLLGAQPR
ncbi:MAG TPA: TetR/AcrR family transcriptional regulator [Microthrixaceae bacterium]|nr:TetR/AcrR family transcriptional regulator [Microthrixaceae bacterium]